MKFTWIRNGKKLYPKEREFPGSLGKQQGCSGEYINSV